VSDRLVAADRREARRTARRTREIRAGVERIAKLKGAFTKAGQFASLRVDLVSPELRSELTRLQDNVPPLAFSQIRGLVEQELGAPLAELFARFDPTPLGAASIAQVHRAELRDGTPVAVKVQYPWLRQALRADLRFLKFALSVGLRWTGRDLLDRERVLGEFASSFENELDFVREARVAALIAANLADDPQIVVPEVVASHSSARVLTMSYVEAVSISDADALATMGVEAGDVLEVLGRAYAKQVFVDGLFHADPHPGNLFVLMEEDASTRPRILFVDFGLSKRLDPELRRELRKGIYALMKRDLDEFVEGMDSLGMIADGAHADVRAAVDAMFTRIAETGGALGVGSAQVLSLKDEAKQLLSETPGLQLPSDLLLYAKTITYLFALAELLDPKVDLMKITLPYLLKFLASKD
jgi:predicted unusual protein kinase regulating ubiquinone biosynthesis (AarF/ABC1/UbiB family)